MTATAHACGSIIKLLGELGWVRDLDLIVKGYPDRPVFWKKYHKVVVGPLWITHYRLVKGHITDQDSIKTEDVVSVERKLKELSRG